MIAKCAPRQDCKTTAPGFCARHVNIAFYSLFLFNTYHPSFEHLFVIYGGPYVPFDEFRLPTFLTSSDFFDEFRLFLTTFLTTFFKGVSCLLHSPKNNQRSPACIFYSAVIMHILFYFLPPEITTFSHWFIV